VVTVSVYAAQHIRIDVATITYADAWFNALIHPSELNKAV